MRLLLIDNGTKNLDALQTICLRHEVKVITADELAEDGADEMIQAADALVLSGSYQHNLVWDQTYFMKEIELVRMTDKPVLGICLGFELICYAFGCQLHELAERASGANVTTPTDDGTKIFQGTDPIKVSEAHRWTVDEVPRELVVLAKSETGIEAVKHRTRPIYGLQFHPEDFRYASDGKMVFANILDSFRKYIKTP